MGGSNPYFSPWRLSSSIGSWKAPLGDAYQETVGQIPELSLASSLQCTCQKRSHGPAAARFDVVHHHRDKLPDHVGLEP